MKYPTNCTECGNYNLLSAYRDYGYESVNYINDEEAADENGLMYRLQCPKCLNTNDMTRTEFLECLGEWKFDRSQFKPFDISKILNRKNNAKNIY